MFSSENLLLHDIVCTLELKNQIPRWYDKEMILTDRALYIYKVKSNYVHDAHCKLFFEFKFLVFQKESI